MQPPSSRTGAWRTHHHRVATAPFGTTTDLSVRDMAEAFHWYLHGCSHYYWLTYSTVFYVSPHLASTKRKPKPRWAFEILFEFRTTASGRSIKHRSSIRPYISRRKP